MNQDDKDVQAARDLAEAIESTDNPDNEIDNSLEEAGQDQPAPKKKSKLMPVVMGLGVVLLLGGLGGGYYYQEILVPQQKAEIQRKKQEAENRRLQKEAEMAAPASDAASSPDSQPTNEINPLANDLPSTSADAASSTTTPPAIESTPVLTPPMDAKPVQPTSPSISTALVDKKGQPAINTSLSDDVDKPASTKPLKKKKPTAKAKAKPVEIKPEDNGYTKLF